MAVANRMNIVTNGPAAVVRKTTDRFKAEWASSSFAQEALPLVGMSRHIVIGRTELEAIEFAAPAYQKWWASLLHLWHVHDIQIPINFPQDFEQARAEGHCIVGTAATVRSTLGREIEEAGVNYLLCRIAFGDLPMEVSMRSVGLMESEIMPAFAA